LLVKAFYCFYVHQHVSDETVSGCSTKLSRALRKSRDNATTILGNDER
jgi:hypothetical protein